MEIEKLFNSKINNLSVNKDKKIALGKLMLKEGWGYFEIKNNRVFFIEKPNVGFNSESNDLIVNKIKIFVKKYPTIFSIIFRSVGISFLGKSSKKAIENLKNGSVILNLGAGPTSVREDVINIDFYPFENVDLIADISDLPFTSNSIDAIICEHVLEHVPSPDKIVSEMYRVLKPGGLVYIVIPFVMSFHSSPLDFYRWSKMGLEEMMKDFNKVESGTRSGPGGAVNYVLAEYFAILFSVGLNKLHQILFICFFILFAPFSWLDNLIGRFKVSENIAQHFYFIGTKK